MFVSVIMTNFNGEFYLDQAIESVLKQSHQYFELIIVDDCSLDNSVALIERWKKIDKRISLHCNLKTKALAFAETRY